MNESGDAAEAGANAFENLNNQAQKAGASIAAALAAGQIEGRKLDDVLRDVGSRLGSIALRTAGSSLATTLTSTLGQALVSTFSSGSSNTAALGTPPSLEGLNSGQSEGSRLLGAATTASAPSRTMNVTLNITTPDAESFRRSEAQVSAALARAMQRGQRSL